MKYVFDLGAGLILLIFLSPLMGIIALLVRVQLGAPIMFKQKRPGLNTQPFFLYKFRTMTDERLPDGELLSDAERLTALGKFLRKYSLDELPQLINVIKGDLSLVGPRPLLMEYLPLYSKEQLKRHNVKPGITGWAQVNGRNAITWEEKFKYDIWYVENHHFFLDLKILCLTLHRVITSSDIQNSPQVIMPFFKGENHYEGKV